MRLMILVLAFFLITTTSVSAYSFSTKMRGQVVAERYEKGARILTLEIFEHLKQSDSAFPVKTTLELSILTSQDAGFIANPKTTTYINKIILPDGSKLQSPVGEMILRQISSIKADWIPLYRTGKLLFEDEDSRRIKKGSIFVIKKAKDGSKKVYAILES